MNSLNTLEKTINHVDKNLARIFLPWALRHPRYLKSFYTLRKTYINSDKTRKNYRKQDIRIPPFLILSITSNCNLQCSGCYAEAVGTISCRQSKEATNNNPSLSLTSWDQIISQACELGIFGFVLAGGEPFLYPELLTLCKKHKDRFFIILTNGTILRNEDIHLLKKLGNVAVIVSIEGDKKDTDERRGAGVYEKAFQTLKKLNHVGTINGISVTITRENYQYWMTDSYIDELIHKGVHIGVFIEYIPTTPHEDSRNFILTQDERRQFRAKILKFREEKSIYIVHSPGDEEYFGGCVSAGRGFAHVTPNGDLTPCPISDIATHNLNKSTLLEALSSSLFKEIRENEHLLETEGMPCALFAHPKEVSELAKKVGAYKTNKK